MPHHFSAAAAAAALASLLLPPALGAVQPSASADVSTRAVGLVAAGTTENGLIAVSRRDPAEEPWQAETQVWTVKPNGSDAGPAFAGAKETNRQPEWSPDGRWIAFLRGPSLAVSRPDGSGARIVATTGYGVGTFDWSPDGTRLVYQTSDWDNESAGEIWVVNVDGTDARRLRSGPGIGGPAWSPDGERIAFHEFQYDFDVRSDTDLEIFTMDLQGGDLRQLTFNEDDPYIEQSVPVLDFAPEWSPDSQRIVYVTQVDAKAGCRNCLTELHVVDADGTDDVRLTYEGNEYSPSWSPDGTQIVFTWEPTPPYRGTEQLWVDVLDLRTMKYRHLIEGDSLSSVDWGVDPSSLRTADLTTRLAVDGQLGVVGAPATASATVVNDGPNAARDVRIDLRLPPGAAAVVAPPGCTVDAVVRCEIGNVPSGEDREVQVAFVSTRAALAEVSAMSSSDTPDVDAFDNRAAASFAACDQLGGPDHDELIGTDGNDVLCGGGGDDEIDGGSGDDVLLGGAGDDTVAGGDGTDRMVFALAPAGVHVDLGQGSATGEGDDSLLGVEDVTGSRFADTLVGDGGANDLDGLGGGDTIDGRGGTDRIDGGAGSDVLAPGTGDDVVDGGLGIDVLDYARASRGVQVDLRRRQATGAGADRLDAVEGVRGSRFRDVLKGSYVSNRIVGGRGNDAIEAIGGNDDVSGGDGGDVLEGGDGFDKISGGRGLDRCAQDAGSGRRSGCERAA